VIASACLHPPPQSIVAERDKLERVATLCALPAEVCDG